MSPLDDVFGLVLSVVGLSVMIPCFIAAAVNTVLEARKR